VAAALSTGELRRFDTDSLDAQVRRTQRRLCRAQRGSHGRRRARAAPTTGGGQQLGAVNNWAASARSDRSDASGAPFGPNLMAADGW
jgi:hypothetical protein